MNVKLFLILLALFLFASPIFAATTTPEVNHHWVAITSGFSMAIASGLCGLAQAKATAAAAEGMGRNPGAAASIRFALILGLVLIESLALYTLVIVLIQVT
jgi:F-type H+-transporting ATPase subunit c